MSYSTAEPALIPAIAISLTHFANSPDKLFDTRVLPFQYRKLDRVESVMG
jgi:hypothetical protein